MDPYKILKVSKNDSLEDIRLAFKRIAKNVHPDKGGSEDMFNIVVEAYRQIFKTKKLEEEKTFQELKQDSQNYTEKQKSYRSVHFENDTGGHDNNRVDEEFHSKFNRVFEENRFTDTNDQGYGDMMTASTPIREDINIEKKTSSKDMHRNFDKVKSLNTSLMKFQEPQALDVYSSRLGYDELGIQNIEDFSSDTRGKQLIYTDYVKAHTTNKLVDKNMIKKQKSFKNLDDISTQRAKQSFEMTEDDRKAIEEQKKKIYHRDAQRAQVLKERDVLAKKHFDQVNKLMLR